jgi:hypothetical protein
MSLCVFILSGCAKKADENKPLADVKAEAEQMDADGLRAMAMKYKEAIVAKKEAIKQLEGKLKDIPLTDVAGAEATKLKEDVANLTKSMTALKERFEVYYQSLKAKEGDLTGLEL